MWGLLSPFQSDTTGSLRMHRVLSLASDSSRGAGMEKGRWKGRLREDFLEESSWTPGASGRVGGGPDILGGGSRLKDSEAGDPRAPASVSASF